MHDLTLAAIETASAGLFDDPDLDFMRNGLCAQTDPEEFFPEQGGSSKTAKSICARCDVRPDCLAYALATDQRHGIWGGTSERERRTLTRSWRRTEVAA